MKKGLRTFISVSAAVWIIFTAVFSSLPAKQVKAEETAQTKLLSGRSISILGDSVSTYKGYTDVMPITDESCTHRYGEAYYGPQGSDCNDTSLKIDDIWWKQSAAQLGADVLMANAGSSTALLYATYSGDADWQLYLEEMLAYKSRVNYLGKDGKAPDIICIYMGSNDVVKLAKSKFGSIDSINFDALILDDGAGGTDYAQPQTAAEAYCILMHKISVLYPDAEVYCFNVLPNSGGEYSTGAARINRVIEFNKMIEEVADYYHAKLVDLYRKFNIDSNNDGLLSQQEWNSFKSYFNEGPHYNAAGFDMVSEAFYEVVERESRYAAIVESRAGVYENVETDVTVTRGKAGMQILRSADNYITDSNMSVDYHSIQKISNNNDSTFTDRYSSHNQIGTYTASGGAEINIKHIAPAREIGIDIVLDAPSLVPPREIPDLERERNVTVTGDVKENDADGIYDYTITTSVDGDASAVTSAVNISRVEGSEYEDNMSYLCSSTAGNDENGMMVKGASVPIPDIPAVEDIVIKDGYSYMLVGHQNFSKYWAARLFTAPAKEGDWVNEEPVYSDEDLKLYTRNNPAVFPSRKLQVPKLYLPGNKVVESEDKFPALYEIIEQFAVVDKNGQVMTCYCADEMTPAEEGFSYNMVNLEDATYYTPDEAHMIRSIASHGYWGSESGFGSLTQMKQYLRESGDFSEEEIARINDGMAMTATQYAIWTFSNKMDEIIFVNVYYATKVGTYKGVNTPDEDVALIFKVYNYLVNLQPTAYTAADANTSNTIINEKNFLSSATLSITGKPEDLPENNDEDSTNDIYTVDFRFSFKVSPSTENGDSLVLVIEDEQGHTVASGRIAGIPGENETVVTADDDGFYTMKNIQLQEGVENLRFQLSGTQNLGYDAYLLDSEVREGQDPEYSQPLVAAAKGHRAVNVRMDISFELDVQDAVQIVEHYYRTELSIPAKKEILVEKQWNDRQNEGGKRPAEIRVRLYANDKEIANTVLSELTGWQYTFENLDVYDENEQEIIYTISEDTVKGYYPIIEGFTIINTPIVDTGDGSMMYMWILALVLSISSIFYIRKRR